MALSADLHDRWGTSAAVHCVSTAMHIWSTSTISRLWQTVRGALSNICCRLMQLRNTRRGFCDMHVNHAEHEAYFPALRKALPHYKDASRDVLATPLPYIPDDMKYCVGSGELSEDAAREEAASWTASKTEDSNNVKRASAKCKLSEREMPNNVEMPSKPKSGATDFRGESFNQECHNKGCSNLESRQECGMSCTWSPAVRQSALNALLTSQYAIAHNVRGWMRNN